MSVPAPGVALVFLTVDLTETEGAASTTFSTTVLTQTFNTATIGPSVLATSNGRNGSSPLGSSSKGSANGGYGFKGSVPGLTILLGVCIASAISLFASATYVL